jgi:transcriptional regulator with XRE-family HTH domain
MTGEELREGRKQRGWTQADLAERLGVSQGYVCLLERGLRPVPRVMAQKVARMLGLPATALPLGPTTTPLDDDTVTTALATLGYPGFAYRRRRQSLIQRSCSCGPSRPRTSTREWSRRWCGWR